MTVRSNFCWICYDNTGYTGIKPDLATFATATQAQERHFGETSTAPHSQNPIRKGSSTIVDASAAMSAAAACNASGEPRAANCAAVIHLFIALV